MKRLIIFIIMLSLSLSILNCGQTKQTQEKELKSTYDELKALVSKQQYMFVGEYVYNNKNREKLGLDHSAIIINKSNIFGNVISLSRENKNINIIGIIDNYSTNYDEDSKNIAIEFNVNIEKENYNIYIDVKSDGKAFFTCKSGLYSISQVGKLKQL